MHLLSIFNKTPLVFVSKRHEKDDIYTFSFKPLKPVRHIAGQHGIFIIPGLLAERSFSLVSTPAEDLVSISTHVRAESKFKQALSTLSVGDRITMFGPILNFTFEKSTAEVVFIAQGIGITPFRSLILHNANNLQKKTVTLIHVDRSDHTFRSELEPHIRQGSYPTNIESFNVAVHDVVSTQPRSTYYISGSPKFNFSTIRTLKNLGISRRNIKTDNFWSIRQYL